MRTPAATTALGVTTLLLTAALGWLLLVGPATSTLGEVRAKGAAAAAQSSGLARQLRTLEDQRDGLDEVRREADRLAVMFPPTADQPGFFAMVTEAAALAGIGPQQLTTLSPTAPVAQTSGTPATPEEQAAAAAEAELAVQTVTITVEASYDAVRDLLLNLERMDRSLLISSVNVNGDAGGGSLTVAIEGRTFVAPPLVVPAATTDTRADAADDTDDTDTTGDDATASER